MRHPVWDVGFARYLLRPHAVLLRPHAPARAVLLRACAGAVSCAHACGYEAQAQNFSQI
jgi:hypothetical protein